MPQAIEIRLLHPEEFSSFSTEVALSLRHHVRPTLEVLPKKQPKTKKATPKRGPRLGVVCWEGNLDEAGWPEKQADQERLLSAAKKMDAIAIWLAPAVKMPPDKTGERKFIAEEFTRAEDFHGLIEGIKHFVQGVEIALVRRVIVIGTIVHLFYPAGQPEPKPVWIDVPKDRKPREITRADLLAALGVTPSPTTDIEIAPPERKI